MRIQVRIPPKTWDQLCLLAQAEHRPPKYQLELLAWQAIDAQAARVSSTAHTRLLREPDEPDEAASRLPEELVTTR